MATPLFTRAWSAYKRQIRSPAFDVRPAALSRPRARWFLEPARSIVAEAVPSKTTHQTVRSHLQIYLRKRGPKLRRIFSQHLAHKPFLRTSKGRNYWIATCDANTMMSAAFNTREEVRSPQLSKRLILIHHLCFW